MKSVAILVIAVSFGALISCNNGRAYNPDTAIESAQAAQSAGAQQQQQTAATTAAGTEQQTATNNPQTPAVAGNAAINPAHGQPGHRCDIAVGAPIPPSLDKPATPVNSPAITPVGTPLNLTPVQSGSNPVTATVPPPVEATPAKSTSGKGLNPAHGQPGHRCDIAVGAPLDSKPAATTTTPASTTPTQPGTITSAPKTVTPNPAPATQKVAAGMNPAHGQPGHRCDIAVGAPLNSKPTTTTAQPSPIQPMPVTPLMPPAKPDSSRN